MAPFLRLVTLLLSFASLQLTLLAGGPGCAMPEGAPAMTGMGMAGQPAAAREPATATHEGAPAAPHSVPCDESAAPQACPTMAPCLFAVLVPSTDTEAPIAGAPATVVAAFVLTPLSETAAPELPPPRA